MPTYTNSHTQFDCAIDGTPFFLGPSSQYPLLRDTAATERQQIDTSTEPGEQSLTSWWYRSQQSFHMGAGLKWYDPVRGGASDQFRFRDSAGVSPWSKGTVKLLPRPEWLYDNTGGGWGDMVSYSDAGSAGVLFADGTTLRRLTMGEADSTVTWGGATSILSLDVTGNQWLAGSGVGIWKGNLPGGAGSKIYDFGGTKGWVRVRWAKEYLFAAVENTLYQLVLAPAGAPAALPTGTGATGRKLFAHPETNWVWSAIEPTSSAVFCSGYAGTSSSINGHRSCIYASSVETANLADDPSLTVPSVVAELPHGEYILTMKAYSDYLILGTNKGVRVCMTNGTQVALGPLSINTDGSCYGLAVWGNHVWAAGAHTEGHYGLYRLDLGNPLDAQGLLFPHARDVYSGHTVSGHTTDYTARLAMLGTSGRVAWYVKNSGVWAAHESELMASGWIETGQLRFDTWEDKVFQRLRTAFHPQSGSITAEWTPKYGAGGTLGTTSTLGLDRMDTAGSDLAARQSVCYRFTLTQATATAGPWFHGYQARAFPTNVNERSLQLPLLCYLRERLKNGRTTERSVWDRVEALEALERSGEVVVYQDFSTGEARNVQVHKVQFITDRPTQSRRDAENPGGMLVVTLRTVA